MSRLVRAILSMGAFIFAFYMSLATHEMMHAIAAHALGGEGNVKFVYLFGTPIVAGGYLDWDIIPPVRYLWIVALAGGIGTAIAWLPFWLLAWRSSTRQDMYLEAISAAMILFQIFYAPTELMLAFFFKIHLHYLVAIAFQLAATVFFFVLYIKKIFEWIDNACGRCRPCN